VAGSGQGGRREGEGEFDGWMRIGAEAAIAQEG
jgi:hypothetical protein